VVRGVYLTFKVLVQTHAYTIFSDQLSVPDRGGGGGPTWKRRGVVAIHGGGRLAGVGPTTMLTGLN
jgi:hypothetical protein